MGCCRALRVNSCAFADAEESGTLLEMFSTTSAYGNTPRGPPTRVICRGHDLRYALDRLRAQGQMGDTFVSRLFCGRGRLHTRSVFRQGCAGSAVCFLCLDDFGGNGARRCVCARVNGQLADALDLYDLRCAALHLWIGGLIPFPVLIIHHPSHQKQGPRKD